MGFALVYLLVLLFNFTKSPILWDEISHLNSGAHLYFGQYKTFVSSAFYPPLYDVLVFFSYKVFGISVFAARLPTVCFSILALWAVFELARYLYDGKVALLSAVILGVMPGVFWISGYAMLETALMFFVTVSLLCFYRWLSTRQDKWLLFVGLTLGLGFLAKHQMLVTGLFMLLGVVFFAQKPLRAAFKRFSLAVVAACVFVVPWLLVAFRVYLYELFDRYFYVMTMGNPVRSLYSSRFPLPIFYFIEIVWPHSNFHPISVFVYVLCLAGLGFMVWRRSRGDKFVLLWFIVIFVFFTFVSNKDWRYVMPLFPALAISASVIVLSTGGFLRRAWRRATSVNRRFLVKFVGVIMSFMVAGAIVYSVYDTYCFVSEQQVTIDIDGAVNYVSVNIEPGRSVLVLCAVNHFNFDMVKFYLWVHGDMDTEVFQYPYLPADAYIPIFDVWELVDLCRENNVQYVLLYRYGGDSENYFWSDLTSQGVYEQLCLSGCFSEVLEEQKFGDSPREIHVITFTG
ncbi:MAG: glycosyltransferase family 39 protein [Candidatus Bathyarchaeota archaeon]|nr:glycosyltransferase family 39 protein [Candidatus Termiticorpusculum sp.]